MINHTGSTYRFHIKHNEHGINLQVVVYCFELTSPELFFCKRRRSGALAIWTLISEGRHFHIEMTVYYKRLKLNIYRAEKRYCRVTPDR